MVQLEKDVSETDRYGRLLRYVYVGGVFTNAELVRRGYAQAATYPPDVKYSGLFVQLDQEARAAGRGLWAPPAPVPPTPTSEPPPRPTGQANVQIMRIYYHSQVYRVESDEYVEITNLGTAPQDLPGWRLMDISEGYPSFTFPSHILGPGESCRVYTNEVHPEYCGFSFGCHQAVRNNSDPDVAALCDARWGMRCREGATDEKVEGAVEELDNSQPSGLVPQSALRLRCQSNSRRSGTF